MNSFYQLQTMQNQQPSDFTRITEQKLSTKNTIAMFTYLWLNQTETPSTDQSRAWTEISVWLEDPINRKK